ncbi:hypothetical protein [Tahibacter aquaticus]|uniref:hypothetical protein n=1 Tax=Tahibacter aquaticus TaxID=520092 RepID=UPI001414F564|nr:hypothetical protein [Tahibacter aquaticus]
MLFCVSTLPAKVFGAGLVRPSFNALAAVCAVVADDCLVVRNCDSALPANDFAALLALESRRTEDAILVTGELVFSFFAMIVLQSDGGNARKTDTQHR